MGLCVRLLFWKERGVATAPPPPSSLLLTPVLYDIMLFSTNDTIMTLYVYIATSTNDIPQLPWQRRIPVTVNTILLLNIYTHLHYLRDCYQTPDLIHCPTVAMTHPLKVPGSTIDLADSSLSSSPVLYSTSCRAMILSENFGDGQQQCEGNLDREACLLTSSQV